MVEFGEKLKQLREEKGMTQQTLGEMLYVTRQAVSRWECGARYPDLLTAKKIAKILDVTVDELLSGEELKEHIEKEPVLVNKTENSIQIVMYTVIAVTNLLMLFVSAFACLDSCMQSGNLNLSILSANSDLERGVLLCVALAGIYFSAKDKMTPRITGSIMCVPYIFNIIGLIVFVAEFHNTSGELLKSSWLLGGIFPLIISVCILVFFYEKEHRLPYWVIVAICLYSVGVQVRYIVMRLAASYTYGLEEPVFTFTNLMLGFVSDAGMAGLLGFQAYKWSRKKQRAFVEINKDENLGRVEDEKYSN